MLCLSTCILYSKLFPHTSHINNDLFYRLSMLSTHPFLKVLIPTESSRQFEGELHCANRSLSFNCLKNRRFGIEIDTYKTGLLGLSIQYTLLFFSSAVSVSLLMIGRILWSWPRRSRINSWSMWITSGLTRSRWRKS